jgi:ribonuclease Z
MFYREKILSHNALRQSYIKLEPQTTLHGFSISGLATYLQIPELDVVFDMGECPISALPLNHVFLTHSHGDHSRCLMRHNSLRKMMGIQKPAAYYIPHFLMEKAQKWIQAEAEFEGVPPGKFKQPNLIAINANNQPQQLNYRKDLYVKAFAVKHAQPSLGYTLFKSKKKLKQEYIGLPPKELIQLRENGIEIQKQILTPFLTFIGDCIGQSLLDEAHIWESRFLVIETTFLDQGEEEMAKAKGHTHLKEVIDILVNPPFIIKTEKIILKHFSMKYTKDFILKRIRESIPDDWHEKILVLL